jgi:hypothetical protein
MNGLARTSLLGAGIGAGLMFLLDPARGRRRRALIRDKMIFAARKTRDAAGATRRDVGNRLYGMTTEVRERFSGGTADDRIVCERVRAELGRVASHPRSIHVSVTDGVATLTGDVLSAEAPQIVRAVQRVRGVDSVQNAMNVHERADGVPSLQGVSHRPGQWTTWLRSGWSPTAMLACAGSTAATLAVLARRAGRSA